MDESLKSILAMTAEQRAALVSLVKTANTLPALNVAEVVEGNYNGKPCPVLQLEIPLFYPGTPRGKDGGAILSSTGGFGKTFPLATPNGKSIGVHFTIWTGRGETADG
jgi:hypothetical protein